MKICNKETPSTILGAFHHHNVEFQEHSEVSTIHMCTVYIPAVHSVHMFSHNVMNIYGKLYAL